MSEGHSPLGASGATRWLACPGSFGLIKAHGLESDESDYAALGTAAHKLADRLLADGREAWEAVGEVIDGFKVGDGEGEIDSNAVQVYLDFCRPLAERADWSASEFTFGKVYQPNPYFWGTADFVAVADDGIHVVDLKFGEGLGVDPVNNPQLMYYAWGFFAEHMGRVPDKDKAVYLTIVQPRYAKGSGEPQTWITTEKALAEWAKHVLLPGMERAQTDDTLVDGEHCRFCPAKLVCPKLRENMTALESSNLDRLDDAGLDDLYKRALTVEMLIKTVKAKVTDRLMAGAKLQNAKLTYKRTTRTWKEGVEERLAAELGDDAYSRELKGPAQVEKLGKKWKDFVKENAFLPTSTGYTLVPATDSAPAADPTADLNRDFAHYGNFVEKD